MKKEHYIALGILVLVIIGQNLYFNYVLSQNRKFIEKQIQTVKDSIVDKENKESKIINTGKTNTQKASETKNNINNKFKSDETIIDNTDPDDTDIEEFLSKYHKRQRDD